MWLSSSLLFYVVAYLYFFCFFVCLYMCLLLLLLLIVFLFVFLLYFCFGVGWGGVSFCLLCSSWFFFLCCW